MPDPSQARLAAEAAFAERPVVSVPAAAPQVVVVKRRKAIAPTGVDDSSKTQPMEEVRTSRVFRVDPPIAGAGLAVEVSEGLSAAEAPPGCNASCGVPVLPAQVVEKKRRRRIPHGEVTIIHPTAPSALVTSDPPESRRPERLRKEPKSLKPGFPALRGAQDFDLGFLTSDGSALSRYLALKTEIKELEQLAAAARKVEAANAVRWIKQAIATYGLSAGDLGL